MTAMNATTWCPECFDLAAPGHQCTPPVGPDQAQDRYETLTDQEYETWTDPAEWDDPQPVTAGQLRTAITTAREATEAAAEAREGFVHGRAPMWEWNDAITTARVAWGHVDDLINQLAMEEVTR